MLLFFTTDKTKDSDILSMSESSVSSDFIYPFMRANVRSFFVLGKKIVSIFLFFAILA